MAEPAHLLTVCAQALDPVEQIVRQVSLMDISFWGISLNPIVTYMRLIISNVYSNDQVQSRTG